VTSTTAEAWLGSPLARSPSLDDLVLRYLGAFGPATVADVTAWSRLTGLQGGRRGLRPRLRPSRDEEERELLYLPDAPRPPADTPAPPRFLPEYDNALLSHADRSRFIEPEQRSLLGTVAGPVHGAVLLDGFVRGIWQLDRGRHGARATLVVSHADRLTKRDSTAIGAEGRRLLRFLAADAEEHDVRFVAAA
jgi:Winged helix DNA-binding domain